jgi:hypothetical protein
LAEARLVDAFFLAATVRRVRFAELGVVAFAPARRTTPAAPSTSS